MKNIGLKKLLIIRAFAIAIRPLCVLAEKLFVGEGGLLPLVLSTGAIIFISTSMPLHLNYYKSDLKSRLKKNEYISSLSILLIIVPVATIIFASIFLSFKLAIIIACFFVIEKLTDELAREKEYRRKYFHWIGAQIYKSMWIILALLFSIFFQSYDVLLLISGLFFALLIILIFYLAQKEKPIINSGSFKLIEDSSKFILGNTLGSFYQQLPRVFVATYEPSVAHLFTVVGQALQAINFIFDTKYIARRRRIMSLKPERFYKPFTSTIISVNISISLLIIFSIVINLLFKIDVNDIKIRSVFVFLIQLADGILYLYMSFLLGYFQWTTRKFNIIKIFLCTILLYFPFAIIMLLLAQEIEGWWFIGINNIAGIVLLAYLLRQLNFQNNIIEK